MTETPFPAGIPCWYELATSDIDGAGAFYAAVFGWRLNDADMEGFTYHVASAPDGSNVAGITSQPDSSQQGPAWTPYITVRDVDQTVAAMVDAGAANHMPPTDVPGTGRFALMADPQGAMFGVLDVIAPTEPQPRPFAPDLTGHGSWNELMTTDPSDAIEFYSTQFGWMTGRAIPLGDMGDYQIMAFGDVDGSTVDQGGIMGLGPLPSPMWLAYFSVEDLDQAAEAIVAHGGKVFHGPVDTPRGARIVVGFDPQGAMFGVTRVGG